MTAQPTLATRPVQASWTMQALKAAAILHVVALLVQAVTAGLLLSTPGGRSLHAASAMAVAIVGLLHLVCAILVWKPGGGSPRFIVTAASLLVLTVVMAALGMAHVKAVHVPLGVAMFGGGVAQFFQVMARSGKA